MLNKLPDQGNSQAHRCKDCRFWKAGSDHDHLFDTPTGAYSEYGMCPLFESGDGTPETAGVMAYAIDRESYAAAVFTSPLFGCPQWESKAPLADSSPNQGQAPEQPKLQAMVSATREELDSIRRLTGLTPELCFTTDDGRTVYEEAGPSIIGVLWEHRRLPAATRPDWEHLPEDVRTALLAMAAESHRWHEEGELDDYRVQEFGDSHPGLLAPEQE